MAMVNFVDDRLGDAIAALKARGMWDNTVVAVAADNGGPISGGANNFGLRGGKFSNWEGGIRVNGFVGGGAVPPAARGTTYPGLMTLWDWYATFAALAGVDDIYDARAAAAGLPQPDSYNQWPAITGANTTSPRPRYYVGSPSNTTGGGEGPTALTQGVTVQGIVELPYKLLIGPLIMNVWTGPVYPNTTGPAPDYNAEFRCGDPDGTMFPQGPGCLFDVVADPSEYTDLASNPAYKDVVTRLRAEIAAAQATVFNPHRGTQNFTRPCAQAFGPYGGFIGPFLP
jgi:arylsulfatase B